MYRGPFIIYSSGAGIKSLLTFHNDQSIWIGIPIKLNLTLHFINTLLKCNPLSIIFCLLLEKKYIIWALFEIMISPDHIWSRHIIFSTKMLITSNKRNYSCGEDVFPTVYYSALDVRTSFSSISFDRKMEHTEI